MSLDGTWGLYSYLLARSQYSICHLDCFWCRHISEILPIRRVQSWRYWSLDCCRQGNQLHPSMAETSQHQALEMVQTTLSHWSKTYMDAKSSTPEWKYYTKVSNTSQTNNTEILAVWSRPTQKEPISTAFARVWFEYCDEVQTTHSPRGPKSNCN